MQVWPQFKNFPFKDRFTAASREAVSSIIVGHFPPNSKIQGVKFLAASMAINRPVWVEPVKQIISNFNWVKAFPTYTFPSTTL